MNYLAEDWFDGDQQEATRLGFGRGLVEVARRDERIVALSADLTDSVGFGDFQREFGDRYIEVGVAEQNLVTVASGVASMGFVPFAGSYSVFSPGRNWEQIRTTICINNQPVKIVGSHTGLNVGPDGATHQMLEDIALMRVLPNMVVLAPGDGHEAFKMAEAMSKDKQPNYVRLAREKSPIWTNPETPFEIGRAYVLTEGSDICLLGTGTMTYQLLLASRELSEIGIQAEVVHVPTIKPLDETTILASIEKCGRAITLEEAQVAGGFGSSIVELVAETTPLPVKRIGVYDKYGESGKASELFDKYGLNYRNIVEVAKEFLW